MLVVTRSRSELRLRGFATSASGDCDPDSPLTEAAAIWGGAEMDLLELCSGVWNMDREYLQNVTRATKV